MGKHALLSASSSHRWLNCPPSARLCEKYEDTGSEYAQEGTDAHSLCDREMDEVRNEMEVTTGLIQKLIDENATRKMDQNDYRKRYDGYVSRYAALESRMDSLEQERKEREFKYDIFSGFLFELGEIHELPLAFDDRLFYQLVDYATVYSDGRVVFTFRNGTEITTGNYN